MVDIPAHRHFSMISFYLPLTRFEVRRDHFVGTRLPEWFGQASKSPDERPSKKGKWDLKEDRAGEIDTGFILLTFDYFMVPDSIKCHA